MGLSCQPCKEVGISLRSGRHRVVPEFDFSLKVWYIAVFWQGANVAGLASKVVLETPQSDLSGVFFGSLGRRWGHLGGPVASQSPFAKRSEN